jgi:hypothetical protein
MTERPHPSEQSVEDLLERAADYRRMAETARDGESQQSLLKLAEAFERLAKARRRAESH